jgi:hypothetical protein
MIVKNNAIPAINSGARKLLSKSISSFICRLLEERDNERLPRVVMTPGIEMFRGIRKAMGVCLRDDAPSRREQPFLQQT